MTRITELLQVTDAEKQKVNACYDKTEKDIKENLDILKEWLKKQPHLPNVDDDLLKNILCKNKFRLEKTKEKLDKYYTIRGQHTDMLVFHTEDIIDKVTKYQTFIPMPMLTDNLERVVVFKVIDPNVDLYSFEDVCKYVIAMLTIQIYKDYTIGHRVVVDWNNMSFNHFTRMYPALITKCLLFYQEAFSSRMLGIEYINAPNFIDTALNVIRPLLKAKLFSRITIHKDLNELYRNVPKKCLPKDFGGDLPPIADIHKDWVAELKAQAKFLENEAKMISDESKRIGELYNKEMFGVEGSFKKINLD